MSIERREQVFVSSTYVDLREERQAIIQTLLQADCFPAGMELFPASDDEKWDLIKRVIDDSDYYIVVIGGRYGSVDEAGLSFTEKEFDYAASTKTPILGFLHGSPGDIPVDKSDIDADLRIRLDNFRQKVGNRMVKYWTTSADLAGAVALSLIQIRKTHPAEGWVRASNALTPELQQQIAELRTTVAVLEKELEAERTQTHSSSLDPGLLAQGSDNFEMATLIRYFTKEDTEAKRTYEYRGRWAADQVTITWDMVFSALAPLMMDEASERKLDEELDKLARTFTNSPKLPPVAGSWDEVQAGNDVVHQVKVQLFSLGLITQSTKRHAVNDDNTYWTLTPDGRDHMLRLTALRRPLQVPTEDLDLK